MSIHMRCPACGASRTWPDYCRGRRVRCPECRRTFVAGQAATPVAEELPEVLPAVTSVKPGGGQPVLDALPVAEGPASPTRATAQATEGAPAPAPGMRSAADLAEVLPVAAPAEPVGAQPVLNALPTATETETPARATARPSGQQPAAIGGAVAGPPADDQGPQLAVATGQPVPPGSPARLQLDRHQYDVWALLQGSFWSYTQEWRRFIAGFVLAPFFLAFGVVVAFLSMLAGYALLRLLAAAAGSWTNYLLYLLPVLIYYLARAVKANPEAQKVGLEMDDDSHGHFTLGRLDDVFDISTPSVWSCFFGLFFGWQLGLLYYTDNQAGFDTDGGLWHCFLLTLNNVCHGVFLYTFQLYNIHVVGKFEHNWLSGTVDYVFRLAFDATAILLAYQMYLRFRLRHLFRGCPSPRASAAEIVAWIDRVSADKYDWPRRYFDEFMFLMLAGQYLRGNFDVVRTVTRSLPRLRVNRTARARFLDPSGQVIFESSLDGTAAKAQDTAPGS